MISKYSKSEVNKIGGSWQIHDKTKSNKVKTVVPTIKIHFTKKSEELFTQSLFNKNYISISD